MGSGQLLFDRKVRLTIASVVARDFATVSSEVVEIEDLRVTFKVNKGLGKEPNTAEVSVFNLNPDRRAKLQAKGGKFILQAGYAGTGLGQIFIGDIRTVSHVREGANWNTKITSGDGERAYRFARVNESFAGGALVGSVIKKIAGKMGLGMGNVPKQADKIQGQYVNGYAAFGEVAAELDKVLASQGLSWSIQDQELQILSELEHVGLLAPELGPETGLIGSPEFGADEKNGGTVIKAKSLILPKLKPGGKVALASERYKGEVRVTKLTHEGDTAGGPWYTSFEGEPLKA